MDNISDVIFTGEAPWDMFGTSVAGVGDMNGDGFNDVLIGGGGKAYFYDGGKSMDDIPDLVLLGEGAGDRVGGPYSATGDLDGDGHNDLIIGDALNSTGGQYSGAAYFYHWVPIGGLEVSIYSETVWNHTRLLSGTNYSLDFANILGENLPYALTSGTDGYGNSYVDIPICATARGEGDVALSNISITYEYSARIPDFKTELNAYILAHQNDHDADGNLPVRLSLASETAGKVMLSDLTIIVDEPPALRHKIPNFQIPEDTAKSDLVDLYDYFEDDYTPDSRLKFEIASATNDTIVHLGIELGYFLSVDSLEGDLNDNWTGALRIIIRATDESGLKRESNPFIVLITNIPDPPVITSVPPMEATGGIQYNYNVVAIDGDNDPLIYGIAAGQRNMTINATTGWLTWTPVSRGTYPVSLTVYDGTFTVFQNYSISVPNRLPRITNTTVPPAITGKPFRYRIPAVDDDNDTIIFSLLSNIPGMVVDSTTGEINWTPYLVGVYPASLRISDPVGFLEYELNITVVKANQRPSIRSIPAQNATVGIPFYYSIQASDSDGDALLFELTTGPSGMSIGPQTGGIGWVPDATGVFIVSLMVTDGNGGEARLDFNLTVQESVRPSVLIERPHENASVHGRLDIDVVLVKGTLNIILVQYRLDGGMWMDLAYNESFVFNIDTAGLSFGGHLLEIRAFDGTDYSETANRRFLVDNTKGTGWIPAATIFALIGILLASVLVILWKRKRNMAPHEINDDE
jgi:hypothetical protein